MPRFVYGECRACGQGVTARAADPLISMLKYGGLGINHAKCIRPHWWAQADKREHRHVDTLYGVDDDGTVRPVVRP